MSHTEEPRQKLERRHELLQKYRVEIRLLVAIILGLLKPATEYGERILELPGWPRAIEGHVKLGIIEQIRTVRERARCRQQGGFGR